MKLIDRLIKIDRFKISASYTLGHFFYDGKIIFETYDKFDMEFENIYLDRNMNLIIGKDSKCIHINIRRKDAETYIFKRFSIEKLDDIMLRKISRAIVIDPNIDETLFDNLGPVYIGWKSVKIEDLKVSEPSYGFNIISSTAEIISAENNLFETNQVIDIEPKQLTFDF